MTALAQASQDALRAFLDCKQSDTNRAYVLEERYKVAHDEEIAERLTLTPKKEGAR